MNRDYVIGVLVACIAVIAVFGPYTSKEQPDPILPPPPLSESENSEIPSAVVENAVETPDTAVSIPAAAKAPSLQKIAVAAEYIEIEEERLRSTLQQVPMENEEILSPGELESLHHTLGEVMLAYQSGDGERLLAEVLAVPYGIDEDALKWSRYHPHTLAKWKPPKSLQIPTDPDDILRRSLLDTFSEEFKGYYTAIAPASGLMKFYRESVEPMGISERLKLEAEMGVWDFVGAGCASVRRKTVYIQHPKQIIKDEGAVLYVDVRLPVADAQDGKRMVLKRLYYAPEAQRWLTHEIVTTFGVGSHVSLVEFL